MSNQYGTIFVNSTPSGAPVKIDGKNAGRTPVVRDLSPGGYNITVELEGYPDFNKSIILRNWDEYPINVYFNEHIPEDPEKIRLSSVIETQSENTTENTTNVTSPIGQETTGGYSVFTVILGMLAAAATGGLAVFVVNKKSDGNQVADTNECVADGEITIEDTKNKVLGLIKTNPGISNAEICTKIGISDRTLSRRVKELKDEGKL